MNETIPFRIPHRPRPAHPCAPLGPRGRAQDVHGAWLDGRGASFQFVVDCLQGDWHVIAPDWRGFGLSERTHSDTYWFPDYVADLDASRPLRAGRSGQPAGPQHGRQRRQPVCRRAAGAGAAPDQPGRLRPARAASRSRRRGATPSGWTSCASRHDARLSQPEGGGGAPAEDQSAPVRRARRFPGAALVGAERAGEWEILGDPAHKKPGRCCTRTKKCWPAGNCDHGAGAVGRGGRHEYVAVDGAEGTGARRDRPPPGAHG
jgi:hypothetical protein